MKSTPIFICAKDRVTYLSRLVSLLQSQGYTNLNIIDTGSTWEPMLDYLSRSDCRVYRCRPPHTPKYALWNCDIIGLSKAAGHYVYTDCDVIPDCPADWIEILFLALKSHAKIPKAGLGLRIDDIPKRYDRRSAVLKWEKQFWSKPAGANLYFAAVDTTLALYRPGARSGLSAVRTGGLYQARHLPWYEDSKHPSPEMVHYRSHLDKTAMAYWTRGTHSLTRA